ncbi:MAG TPA: hypothetical protein VN634_04030 [Candidatus Limnocylindrales bacterium]|nr:hypothetical protein [Candidatus Limnocylindrales bacterium]
MTTTPSVIPWTCTDLFVNLLNSTDLSLDAPRQKGKLLTYLSVTNADSVDPVGHGTRAQGRLVASPCVTLSSRASSIAR